MSKIFVLSWSHWEDYKPYIFLGPDDLAQQDFRKITDNLIEQASLNAINESKNDEYPDYVGWESIVSHMVPLLKDKGFEYIEPTESCYFGPSIINDEKDTFIDCTETVSEFDKDINFHKKSMGPVKDLIIEHNKEIYENNSVFLREKHK